MRASEPPEAGEQRRPGGEARAEGIDDQQVNIKLTANQIETAGIELATVQDGTLTHRIVVPCGPYYPVSVRSPVMVTELRKMLGEQVDLDLDIGGIGTRVDRQHRQCPGTDTTRRSLMATDFLSTLAP
jgi:hypothetical protein